MGRFGLSRFGIKQLLDDVFDEVLAAPVSQQGIIVGNIEFCNPELFPQLPLLGWHGL